MQGGIFCKGVKTVQDQNAIVIQKILCHSHQTIAGIENGQVVVDRQKRNEGVCIAVLDEQKSGLWVGGGVADGQAGIISSQKYRIFVLFF